MTVLLQDFLSGNLGSTLASGTAGAVTDSSFAALPVVAGSDTIKLVLDPDGTAGDPEIITITVHTSSSTTATITRASEGTTARQHLATTKWVNAVTTTDFNRLGFDGTIAADLTGNVTGNASGTAGVATTVTLTDEGADATCFPVFAQDATGNVALETDASALTYNATNGELTATTFVGAVTGNVTGNASGSSGSCTGNAATATLAADATKLATARAINGVAFNGTAPITVTAAAGTLSGTELKAEVVTSSLTSVGTLTALTVSGTTNSSGITNSGGDITNANNYFQTAGVIRNIADQDWALRVGNDAAVTTPDNKAVVAVVWDSNHGSAANMGISLMFNESVSTKTFLKFQYATGVDGGNIQSNGTTTTLNNPSDIRYKENITSVSGAVDALRGVDVISYNRIGHDVTRVGFSAQNVQSIPEFAEFVRTEEDDEDARLHLAESEFVPYLVKAVQELTDRLEAVEG